MYFTKLDLSEARNLALPNVMKTLFLLFGWELCCILLLSAVFEKSMWC